MNETDWRRRRAGGGLMRGNRNRKPKMYWQNKLIYSVWVSVIQFEIFASPPIGSKRSTLNSMCATGNDDMEISWRFRWIWAVFGYHKMRTEQTCIRPIGTFILNAMFSMTRLKWADLKINLVVLDRVAEWSKVIQHFHSHYQFFHICVPTATMSTAYTSIFLCARAETRRRFGLHGRWFRLRRRRAFTCDWAHDIFFPIK